MKRFMTPVPPGQPRQPVGDGFRKPPPDRPRRIAANDGVGGNILGDDCTGRNHRPGSDAAARQDYRAMSDPDVMADVDAMALPPGEELGIVALSPLAR